MTTESDSNPPSPPLTPEQRIRAVERRVKALEDTIGDLADPIAKTPATGLVGAVVAVQVALEGLTAELKAEKEARERRSNFLGKLSWGLSIPLAVAALLGAGALLWRWASTLHH